MAVKPTKTVRTFTVEQHWSITREDLKKIICDHLGIPADDDTNIVFEEWCDTEVVRTTYNVQTE